MTWQPISTAPKDGMRVLLWPVVVLWRWPEDNEMGAATGKWDRYYGGWVCSPNEATECDYDVHHPTHWQPLPEPPSP